MRVQDLTPEIADQLGVDDTEGVVVSSVDPSGPAREAGIRRGDVIVEVDKESVKDAEQLQDHLAEAEERALLLIRRGESQLYVPIKRQAS
jgi:serine protease Do